MIGSKAESFLSWFGRSIVGRVSEISRFYRIIDEVPLARVLNYNLRSFSPQIVTQMRNSCNVAGTGMQLLWLANS